MSIVRIINIIVIILIVVVLGCFSSFAIVFGGAGIAYVCMCMISTLALIYYIIRLNSATVDYRKLNRSALLYAGICLIIIGIKEGEYLYLKSITIVTREVDLSEYQPFTINSKAADLKSPSTLKLEEDLPVMDGATALYPVYSAFARAVYSHKNHLKASSLVMCSTTSTAYDNLINNQVDIIFVAKPSQRQLDSAAKKGVQLLLTPIGKEAFVFFVNKRNKISTLKLEEIRQIYAGKISNWQQVGGSNDKITAFQRPEGSGSQTMLINVMDGLGLTTPPTDERPQSMGGIVRRTADYKNFNNSIGFSFLFYVNEMTRNNGIKIIAVDGITPNKTTINDGSYPLTTPLYAVTTQNPSPNTHRLLKWIIGPQGQSLVQKTGYTPLK